MWFCLCPRLSIAAILVGIPLNWMLGGTRSALQRIAIAIVSVPATLLLADSALHFQRTCAGHICVALTFCRLDLAIFIERAQLLGRYSAGSGQGREYR